REDFAGTSAAAVEWVRSGDDRHAWAVDFDAEVLEWGRRRHIEPLTAAQQQRIQQIEGDVLEVNTPLADIIIGFNFSYFTFKTRDELRGYFERARRNLKPDGLLFVDCFGGSEAYEEVEEETDLDGFTYVWDQDDFDPVSSQMHCHIHFDFPDGTKMRPAFSYEWRLWTLPEIRELLKEAGFSSSTVYWEGTDEDGEGDGEFEPVSRGEADPAWIAYIVAER
ncbi:MAG: class I SAM-dependent methyltransferase, partial [Gammaproteobacteria bacterium]|nr:class I SAM-dependent methyltransferase [Gammaproteobacteria bacterium]